MCCSQLLKFTFGLASIWSIRQRAIHIHPPACMHVSDEQTNSCERVSRHLQDKVKERIHLIPTLLPLIFHFLQMVPRWKWFSWSWTTRLHDLVKQNEQMSFMQLFWDSTKRRKHVQVSQAVPFFWLQYWHKSTQSCRSKTSPLQCFTLISRLCGCATTADHQLKASIRCELKIELCHSGSDPTLQILNHSNVKLRYCMSSPYLQSNQRCPGNRRLLKTCEEARSCHNQLYYDKGYLISSNKRP